MQLPTDICRLLVGRGYSEEAAIKPFLRPALADLHDPALLAGVQEAVARLELALRRRERILVHGDYDVDGICATVIYTRALQELGGDVVPFVPCRARHGYDLGPAGVKAAQDAGAGLILTGDCGIVAHDAVSAAARVGLDVIVTDHHTPAATLPPALAVVNPRWQGCGYPDKNLAGAGVAFKLCEALAVAMGLPRKWVWQFLDLVALATVADLAPLVGENRVLVRWGLKLLSEQGSIGLRALIGTSKLATEPEITAGHVSHVLAPRINAAGRLGDAGRAMRLLLTSSEPEAAELARALEQENRERQRLDRRTLDEALELLQQDYDPESDYGVVLGSAGWHPGVIGIVASRIVERIQRPVLLVALQGDGSLSRGSGRSIPGFHLYEALQGCSNYLERFGGHRHAVGFDVMPERLPDLRAAFNQHARSVLRPEHLEAALAIDLELPLSAAGGELLRFLKHFAPFGIGNPAPVFVSRGVSVAGGTRLVGGGHLKLTLAQEGVQLPAIGFGMGQRKAEVSGGGALDVVYQLQEDRWQGRARLQAKLLDLRTSG